MFPTFHLDVMFSIKIISFMKEINNEVYAAIAMALHEYCGNAKAEQTFTEEMLWEAMKLYNVHDKETGVITIHPRATQWNGRQLSMTKCPKNKQL